jgi:hypothetical protein
MRALQTISPNPLALKSYLLLRRSCWLLRQGDDKRARLARLQGLELAAEKHGDTPCVALVECLKARGCAAAVRHLRQQQPLALCAANQRKGHYLPVGALPVGVQHEAAPNQRLRDRAFQRGVQHIPIHDDGGFLPHKAHFQRACGQQCIGNLHRVCAKPAYGRRCVPLAAVGAHLHAQRTAMLMRHAQVQRRTADTTVAHRVAVDHLRVWAEHPAVGVENGSERFQRCLRVR